MPRKGLLSDCCHVESKEGSQSKRADAGNAEHACAVCSKERRLSSAGGQSRASLISDFRAPTMVQSPSKKGIAGIQWALSDCRSASVSKREEARRRREEQIEQSNAEMRVRIKGASSALAMSSPAEEKMKLIRFAKIACADVFSCFPFAVQSCGTPLGLTRSMMPVWAGLCPARSCCAMFPEQKLRLRI